MQQPISQKSDKQKAGFGSWLKSLAGIAGIGRTAPSVWTLVYAFAVAIAVGTLLLMLPAASRSGAATGFVTALFTATSAVCTTGLVVVDTLSYWSFFGQSVILILIQLGGLGFMTSATVLFIIIGRRIGLRERIFISKSVGGTQIGGAVNLARNIALFTFIAEAAGAVIFFTRFSSRAPMVTAVWDSVFQSVSAFNTAGFDLFGDFRSMSGFSGDYLMLLTTSVLVILGSISFVAIQNLFSSRGYSKSSVDTKIVLWVSGSLLLVGTLIILAAEFGSAQTLGNMPVSLKVLNSFFQTVNRTAGFSSFNNGALIGYSLFFMMLLMLIGGAAGSTAGGIKVNTVGLLLATVWSSLKGMTYPGAFGREFSPGQVNRALFIVVAYLTGIALVATALNFTEGFPFVNILYETVSAFGNVGLSTGITPDLSTAGRLLIVFAMFLGRFEPLVLSMVLVGRQRPALFRYPEETIRIG